VPVLAERLIGSRRRDCLDLLSVVFQHLSVGVAETLFESVSDAPPGQRPNCPAMPDRRTFGEGQGDHRQLAVENLALRLGISVLSNRIGRQTSLARIW
jgi:hypothetical protein